MFGLLKVIGSILVDALLSTWPKVVAICQESSNKRSKPLNHPIEYIDLSVCVVYWLDFIVVKEM